MQIPSLVAIAVLSVSSAFARDFRPPSHLENIPLANSSIQQCYVFQTTPGVAYTVESSDDLTNWTAQDELYGLGNEYVVTMREYTPPPPPPPGTPPAVRPPPAKNISLRLQRASGAAGGSVVSWPSLDHGGPVVVRIDGNMDPGWSQIPIFTERFGNFYFFFWHPTEVATPPAENSILGPNDSAMLAVLEASLPAMNQQVADSMARSRNAPPLAPPEPGSKRFWRVKVDAGIDTDQDGSPDWAEFEISTLGSGRLVPGVVGDAFNEDTNNDGIPDGLQLDSDGDGTPDGIDINPSDNTATFPIGPAPRYALFPITNATPTFWYDPIKISDRGTVLFYGGTWAGGVWTPLSSSSGQVTSAWGRTINDNDVIAGLGNVEIKATGGAGTEWSQGLCYWYSPSAQPFPMVTDQRNAYGFLNDTISEDGITTAPVLSNDGRMVGLHAYWLIDSNGERYHVDGITTWSIPASALFAPSPGTPVTEKEWFGENGISWGMRPRSGDIPAKGIVAVNGQTLSELPFVPLNIIPITNGILALRPSADTGVPQAFVNGSWKESPFYQSAFDISLDGTAIGRGNSLFRAPILINGDWKSIFQYAPQVPASWNNSSVKVLDTTPGGWVLAEEGDWPLPSISYPKYAVLLPIRADGVDPALSVPPLVPPADPPEYIYGGVDHTSMTAHSGNGRVPEIWIMAPNGGASNSVRFQSPLNPSCKLTLESDADIDYVPGELDSKDKVVQVKGKKTDTADFTAKLKLGGTLDSLSVPLKIKAMKKRTVKVAVHKVFGIDKNGNQTVPSHFPTMTELDTYLNEVFGRQANTFFQCTQHDEKGPAGTGIDFDLGISDGKIRYAIDDPEVQALTVNPKSTGGSNATANIDVWVFGGGVVITDYTKLYSGYQIGGEFEGKILIDGDLLGAPGTASELSANLMNTIAHEIGHVMEGRGHAHDGTCKSDLIWKPTASGKYQRDSRNNTRLMATGLPLNLSNSSKQLIKKEWDLMEAWLKKQEDDGKL